MTALRRLRRTRKGIYHVKWPTAKHVENSIRGILYAIAHWFLKIDLDLSITKADPNCPKHYHPDGKPCRGHIVACHWPKPMRKDGFRDPLGLLHPDTCIWDMTLPEALRLRTRDGYRIQLIEVLLTRCAGHIIALLEPKGDERFEQDWPWLHIRSVANATHCQVEVYALPANAGALPFARNAGFTAWIIGGKP